MINKEKTMPAMAAALGVFRFGRLRDSSCATARSLPTIFQKPHHTYGNVSPMTLRRTAYLFGVGNRASPWLHAVACVAVVGLGSRREWAEGSALAEAATAKRYDTVS
jgi:hypothetical protein